MAVLDNWGPATAMMMILVAMAGIAGAIVCITSDALQFEEYLDLMKDFSYGVGALAVGRGIMSGLKNHGQGDVS